MPNKKFLLFGLVVVATIFTMLYRFLITNTGARGICQTISKIQTIKSIKL